MSTFLLKIEAIESRVASYSCPRGTTSRILALRLRHHFQTPRRLQSTVLGAFEDWDIAHKTSARHGLDIHVPGALQEQREEQIWHSSSPQYLSQTNEKFRSLEVPSEDILPMSRDVKENTGPLGEFQEQKPVRKVPPHMLGAYYGDTFGLPLPQRQHRRDPHTQNGNHLRKALLSGNPHDVLSALTDLIKVGEDGYQASNALSCIPPNTFSEILRCLDPKHFVGRYIDLHRQISLTNSPYVALQSRGQDGLQLFRIGFLARIRSLIEARRLRGFELSIVDCKYLLRSAREIGNPKAAHAIWLAMESSGIKPDTQCYNDYLGAKVWSDLLNSSQRYNVRVIPEHLSLRKAENVPQGFQGHLVGGGKGIKHQTAVIFNKMAEEGILGDEETFCLLMIALAREGDLEGMKGILARVWGIDVDRLMTKDENDLRAPKEFPIGSSLRPSRTLLFAIAHAFGINNNVLGALRLVDYVARNYSIDIPFDVWEEVIERTYVLSTQRTLKKRAVGMRAGHLPPGAMSNIWDTMISEPYNVKPTMVMYDKLILDLLRRQRFGEAQERMEEALGLHMEAVQRYSQILAAIGRQSPAPEIIEASRNPRRPVALPKLSDLQRDKNFHHLYQHRSRQYLRRWCRIFINLGSRYMRNNQVFSAVQIPLFIQKYTSFMPRRIEYLIPTGTVHFNSGSESFNTQFVKGLALKKMEPKQYLSRKTSIPNSSKSGESAPGTPITATLDIPLESEDMFGKS